MTARRILKIMELRMGHMKKFLTGWVWIVFCVAILVTIGFCKDAYALRQWTCRTGPSRVIRLGDRFSVVLMKCGNPTAKYQETTDEGAVTREEWIYARKDAYIGFYNYILLFEEGKLVKIEKEID